MNTPVDQLQSLGQSQAPSVRVPKRFPLVSSPGFRSTTINLQDLTVRSPVSDSIILNGYAELDPSDNSYWVEKRLGTVTVDTKSGSAGGVGVAYATGVPRPIAIFGSNVWALLAGVLQPVNYAGTHATPFIPGRAGTFIPITTGPSSTSPIWCVNGSLWQISSISVMPFQYLNILDIATSVPWPLPLCDGVAFLDGVTYVMDQNGAIWGSNFGTLTTWVGTTVIQAGGRDDFPVYLAQQLEYIIALKSTSLRCFYDSGAAAQTAGTGSNLAWVEGADANIGCLSGGGVQLIDQTLVWVTNNSSGTAQVARMDGLQVTIISTPPVERLLQTLDMASFSANPNGTGLVVYSSGIKRGGHRFYVFTAPGGATLTGIPFTIVYDLDQQLWYIWYSASRGFWGVTGITTNASLGISQGLCAQDISSGAFYITDIDQIYPTDSGTPCQVDIYTPNADLGNRRRKQLNAMYFVNDQVSGSYMQVRKSDDDYRSWSPFRQVSLGVRQPSLTRCGTFRRRALNIRHQAATPFRIKAADVQIDIGTL